MLRFRAWATQRRTNVSAVAAVSDLTGLRIEPKTSVAVSDVLRHFAYRTVCSPMKRSCNALLFAFQNWYGSSVLVAQ